MSTFRYGVSAVQYDLRHNRIKCVQAHRVSPDDKLSELRIYDREAVVQAIDEKRLPFVTLPTAHDGKFTIGAEIMLVKIDDGMFIKVTANQVACDDLGDLPEF